MMIFTTYRDSLSAICKKKKYLKGALGKKKNYEWVQKG